MRKKHKKHEFTEKRIVDTKRIKQLVVDFRSEGRLLANGKPLYYSTIAEEMDKTPQYIQSRLVGNITFNDATIEAFDKVLKKLGVYEK